MKKQFLLLALFAAMCSGCSKKDTTGSTRTKTIVYKGVIRISGCGRTTIETIGDNLIGEKTWVATPGTDIYHYAFRVLNFCQFSRGGHAVGDTVYFRIIPFQPQLETCGWCEAFVPAPRTAFAIDETIAFN